MSIRKAVIPAAGLGTRLHPATRSQPKEMLPLGRKPTIQLAVEEVVAAGLREILVITGEKKRAIEDHFDQANGLGIEASFFFTRQSVQRGLGDAVACARHFVGDEPFVVALGDCLIWSRGGDGVVARMLALHEEKRPAATIAVQRVPADRLDQYGVVAPRAEQAAADDPPPAFEIGDIVEKPGPDRAPSNLAVTARYVLDPMVFEFLDRTPAGHGGEVQLTDALRLMLQAGHAIWCVPLGGSETRYDVGSFVSYWKAFADMMVNDPEVGEELRAYLRTVLEKPG
ncbi:MAG: UTP--glucose-1-phosphate uridylyltransferase [Armatimonadota bacterium]